MVSTVSAQSVQVTDQSGPLSVCSQYAVNMQVCTHACLYASPYTGHPCEPLISRANKDCERASGTAFHVNGGDALMFDHLDEVGNVTVAAIHAGCDLTEAYDHSGRSVPVKITLAKQLLRSPSVSCGKGRASHCSQCDPKMCGGDCSKGDGKCIRAKSTADEL